MVTVSAIIPCYRQATFLPQALESVLRQTHPVHEIIVVDDGSPDHTEQVVKDYPAVRYLRQWNQGVSAARNTGIRVSEGEYLVFLDADDRLLPHHVEASLNAFGRSPDASAVIGDFRYFGGDGLCHTHDCARGEDLYARLLLGGFPGVPCVAMVRHDVVKQLGGFRTSLRCAEDHDLWLRVARTGRLYCHHEVVAEYRRYEGQLSRQWHLLLPDVIEVHKAQRPYVRAHPRYEEAYRAGLAHHKRGCGEPLLWQFVSDVRTRNIPAAWRDFRTLVRWYPAGLSRLFLHKVLGLSPLAKAADFARR